MQAVILAAGKSSRLFPFGNTSHKATLSLMGKSLIQRTIESLRSQAITEIIVVVSPDNGVEVALKESKIDLSGIRLVTHMDARGMGEALLDAAPHIKGDFFLLHAHHFECEQFLPELLAKKEKTKAGGVLLLREEESTEAYGIVTLREDLVTDITEKPEGGMRGQRIVGMYLLPSAFLHTLQQAEKHHYSFESALDSFVKTTAVAGVVTKDEVITLKYPWHILAVSDFLLSCTTRSISDNANIAKTAVLEGEIFIESGVVIEEGAVIKGPCYIGKNAYVGTNAILRGGVIVGEKAVIGANMEVKHSVIMRNATTHSGYIGDSVIGESCKIAASFCTGNVRIDRKNVIATVKEEKVDTGLRSVGAFIGTGTKVGIRVSTMPGVLVGANVIIGPSTTIFGNIPSDVKYYTKITEVVTRPNTMNQNRLERKVVLFDIDYTLFDTKAFKDSQLKTFSVYEEVVDVLGEIGAYAELGIFSEGEKDFQKAKLLETTIESHFPSEHVHIVTKKNESIAYVLDRYEKDVLFLVDDKLEVLFLAKKHNPKIYTIWIKRGPFALSQKPLEDFSPDASIEDLRMVLPLVVGI